MLGTSRILAHSRVPSIDLWINSTYAFWMINTRRTGGVLIAIVMRVAVALAMFRPSLSPVDRTVFRFLCGKSLILIPLAFMSVAGGALANPSIWTRIDASQIPAIDGAMKAGEVKIDLAGDRAPGSAFRFTSDGGITVLFDPWQSTSDSQQSSTDLSGSWGVWFPEDIGDFDADALISAHAAFDRDVETMPDGVPVLDHLDGSWAMGDVRVTGFPDHNITLLVISGIRFVIWGEGLIEETSSLWQDIGEVDVLLLPIEASQTSLSYDEADRIIKRVAPDMIVPGLYLTAGVDASQNQLGDAEEWSRQQNYFTILREPHLSITAQWVHSLDKHVQYFGAHQYLE